MKNYDVVVIGAGPGGYVAAIRAAHHGLKTAIVEKDKKLGGTCLLRGCIPTKSLLHSADVYSELQEAKSHGVLADNVRLDFDGVQKARTKVITKSAAGVAYLMKQNKIDVIKGMGRLKNGNTVEVSGGDDGDVTLNAKYVILATGSVPRAIPPAPIDGEYFITSNEMLELKEPPKSLIVLGAGAVGVEFASVYARFGTECTIVEMLDRALPNEDREVSAEFEKALKKRGINCLTGHKLEKAEVKDGMVHATISDTNGSKTLEAEKLLVAVGRAPVTENLGLKEAGVKVDQGGFVEVDEYLQTTIKGVYAIGDIIRTPQLAHTASAEAMLAVDHVAGKLVEPINYLHNPGATYADPEVASVGLTEEAAKEKGYTIKIGKYPFSALGKARILGKSEGFVKIVADAQYDEILGVHIIGPHATDLIAEAVLALRMECTTEELARTIHAHPTLPEAMLEAAHGANGRPIHL